MLFPKKQGYKVKLRGRSEVEYIENDRRIIFGSEFLAGDAGIVIYSGSASWEPPHESEHLSGEDLKRIKNNVLEDLSRHKIKAEWD